METATMIPVKEAIASAIRYFTYIYGDAPFKNVRLEEVEMTADSEEWRITLGFDNQEGVAPLALEMKSLGGFVTVPREYKTISVSTKTGDVIAMKIRTLNND